MSKRLILIAFSIITLISFTSLFIIYLDTYYLRSYRTVRNIKDPRWRVIDFNSRLATESEIYSVRESPALKTVKEIEPHHIRLIFHEPFNKTTWTIQDLDSEKIIASNPQANIFFPEMACRKRYRLIPEEKKAKKDIILEIDFHPKENYQKKGLSWPDNYWLVRSTIPVTPRKPFSIDEWTGLSPADPELLIARDIIRNDIDWQGTTLKKAEQVFLFVMKATKNARGTPDDQLQSSSPLKTYRLLIQGQSRGFCENLSLVYYIFANAVGVKTRLVDMAGKVGPLKLTGHYFCESYIEEADCWIYVDPQSGIARAIGLGDKLLTTLDIKKYHDLGLTGEIDYFFFDSQTEKLCRQKWTMPNNYFMGDLIIAYKFGYGRTKSYSKIKNFLCHPTLLYSTFYIPNLILVKNIAVVLFGLSFLITLSLLLERFFKKK